MTNRFLRILRQGLLELFVFIGFALIASCGSSLFLRPEFLQSESESVSWTQFGGSASRSHTTRQQLLPPLRTAWQLKTSSTVGPNFVLVDSLLYYVTLDGRVEVVKLPEGQKIAGTRSPGAAEATIAYYQDSLIIASRTGKKTLGRLDLTSGKYLWQLEAGHIETEPAIAGDAVYVAALYNHVDKYDLSTGEKLWTLKTDAHLHSSPAMSRDILVVGSDDGTIYAIDAQKGESLWIYQTHASVFASPLIWEDTVVVGSQDSVLYALDLHLGELVWTFHAGKPIFLSAATDGQRVVFGVGDGTITCLDLRTGVQKWGYRASSGLSTPPLITPAVVYFGSLDRSYYGVELETGKLLWRFTTDGRVRTAPLLWGNYLFGASEDRHIYAFVRYDSTNVEIDNL